MSVDGKYRWVNISIFLDLSSDRTIRQGHLVRRANRIQTVHLLSLGHGDRAFIGRECVNI